MCGIVGGRGGWGEGGGKRGGWEMLVLVLVAGGGRGRRYEWEVGFGPVKRCLHVFAMPSASVDMWKLTLSIAISWLNVLSGSR